MHWNTSDKSWLKQRKLQWKGLKKRIVLSEDDFGRDEIKVLKNYFLTGEIIKTGDFRDFPLLVLILAWHPSDDLDSWWQLYLSLKQEHKVEIGDCLARSYRYIKNHATPGILIENPEDTAPNLFMNREKLLYQFFFEFNSEQLNEIVEDNIFSQGVTADWQKKANDYMLGTSFGILSSYSYLDERLHWYTSFQRSMLPYLSTHLTAEYFHKVDKERRQGWQLNFFNAEVKLYKNRKKLPKELCEIVDAWVEQIEMDSTATEWQTLWSNSQESQTIAEVTCDEIDEDDLQDEAELAEETEYEEESPFIAEWPKIVDLLENNKLVSKKQKLKFNPQKYYYLHELLSDLLEKYTVYYGDLTEDISIYANGERAEFFGDVVSHYIEASEDGIKLSSYEEKDFNNSQVKISFRHKWKKYSWEFDVNDPIAVSQYYKGVTNWANKALAGNVFFAGTEESFYAFVLPKLIVNELEKLGFKSSVNYFGK